MVKQHSLPCRHGNSLRHTKPQRNRTDNNQRAQDFKTEMRRRAIEPPADFLREHFIDTLVTIKDRIMRNLKVIGAELEQWRSVSQEFRRRRHSAIPNRLPVNW